MAAWCLGRLAPQRWFRVFIFITTPSRSTPEFVNIYSHERVQLEFFDGTRW